MEYGHIYTIDKKNYMVIGVYNNYFLLLNVMESEKDRSGDIILVEHEKKNNIKVIKDRDTIKSIVTYMLND